MPEKPILTVDVAYLAINNGVLEILIITRPEQPFKGQMALPGGYVHCDKDLDLTDAARRIIRQKVQLEPDYIEQVETVASRARDPRGWTATVLHLALVSHTHREQEQILGRDCQWVPLASLTNKTMAFDHGELLKKVEERLIAKSRYTSIPLFLLPLTFTLTEAQRVFEIATQSTLEKKSFRRRLLDAEVVVETGEQTQTGKRKAALYKINHLRQVHYFPRMIG